jgi:hypothetical protein
MVGLRFNVGKCYENTFQTESTFYYIFSRLTHDILINVGLSDKFFSVLFYEDFSSFSSSYVSMGECLFTAKYLEFSYDILNAYNENL